jgi:hypothetical protein
MSKILKWLILLTFPIWFYWFTGFLFRVPAYSEYYLIATYFSYYAFLFLFPLNLLGFLWIAIIIYFVWKDFIKKIKREI